MSDNNIHTAINAIMQNVGYVKKARANGLGYTYAGEAALIEAIRPEMVEQKVTMTVSDYSVVSESTYTTRKGSVMQDVRVKANICFHHAPSNSFVMVCSLGEGADTSDKAMNKAMTGAYKYALRQTFCIETGDDPDKERADRANKTQQQGATTPKPQEKPATVNSDALEIKYSDKLKAVTSSDGTPYYKIDTADLSHRLNSLSKYKEPTDEQLLKIKAIKAIFKLRQ